MNAVRESDLELATLEWFADLGYEVLPADNLDPESAHDERSSLEDTILQGRLAAAVRRINPELSEDAVAEVLRRVLRRDAPTLPLQNEALHRLITRGVEIDVAQKTGGVRGTLVRLIDFDDPEANDWVVSNQVPIVDRINGRGQLRRPDVVVWVNGLPLAVFELKNPADPNADIGKAIRQLDTYKADIPSLFATNAVLVISDDVHAKIGSLTADASRFAFWRTITGEKDEPKGAQPLDVLVRGVFDKARFLDLVRSFTTFEHDRGEVQKKVAGYHQFHAVRRAVEETVRAVGSGGDKRIGVVWHTQGSGKSLSMVFYAGKLVLDPRMENPTIVVLTDRNDLDDQLFGTFAKSEALIRQTPVQAADRKHLHKLLRTASGGVYFTTIQKFLPEEGEKTPTLSTRRNIVVIADEAHRSQYGFEARIHQKTGATVYGLAKHLRDALPDASFIGFTGTPIELDDRSTVQVFGDTISRYDIQRAVDDKATVPIFYESRLARLDLDEVEKPHIDTEFDEVTEGEEEGRKEALKSDWSRLEALVGTEKRLRLVARDVIEHFEKRLAAMDGKAMVVCMSRRIAAELHDHIVALRPTWRGADDDSGAIKVIITGSASDVPLLRPHVRSKAARERLAERFKDPKDPLKIVIVRDMWLTGFDAPCLHTLYVDKPMQGHNLMQAIARVNRVFGDKPAGLVVDYLGIAPFLKKALATYTASGGKGAPSNQQDEVVALMLEQLEICRDVLHGFDIPGFLAAPPAKRLALLPMAREHVLAQRGAEGQSKNAPPDGHDRYLQAAGKLTTAFAAAVPHERCDEVRDEVAFHQAVRAGLLKLETGRSTSGADLSHAVRQIVANAVVPTEVVDVFAVAGLPKPDISILSPEFLADIRGMQHKNLAAELLRRLLLDEVRTRQQTNVVQGRKFSEMLEDALRRYRARTITTVEVIDELLEIARIIREGDVASRARNLSREESAFFDALADNDSAVEVLKDAGLAAIARELTEVVHRTATIDWNQKKSVQAKLRLAVKKVLKKRGYPPDGTERATQLVLEQAERLKINVTEGASEAPTTVSEETAPVVRETAALPAPLAIVDGLVRSQANAVLRVKTRRDGFEKALTFLAAIGLALLRQRSGGTVPEKARKAIGRFAGKPLSMGGWFELACAFAAELPPDANDPVVTSVRALVTADGKRSALAHAIETEVIPDRNMFSHSVTATEEAVAATEQQLKELWTQLERDVEGLRCTQLVALAGLVDADPTAGTVRYQVRQLHGSPAHFPIREVTLRDRLEEGWTYILHGDRALSLAPVVACVANDDGAGHGLFLAREVGAGSEKAVETVSLTSGAKRKIKVRGR
ncbi:type I restriction endonuclease subunit R [Sorangium sp. So ce117]